MSFEVYLSSRIEVSMLRTAGMKVERFQDRSYNVMIGKAQPPFEVQLPYFLSDSPQEISVALLEYGELVRLRIGAAEKSTERKIRKVFEHYSAENDGEARVKRELEETWKQIKAVLERAGLDYELVSRGKALLNRRAIEGLIQLAGKLVPHQVDNIDSVFSNGPVARADKEIAVRWLMKRMMHERDPYTRGALGLRVWENVIPAVGDDIIKLMEHEIGKYGSAEVGLIMALAQTKHPRAADFIATHLDKPAMAWGGLQALAKLKATQHVEKIRRYLRDPELRGEAKKALKKLGVPVDAPPPPVHLVRGRAKIPKNLEEWSQNTDMSDLEPILKKLVGCIDRGFGENEVAEVVGVVEEMKPGQTRSFCFPITAAKKPGEMWLVIFMDDVDSPDVEVYASRAVLKRFAPMVPLD